MKISRQNSTHTVSSGLSTPSDASLTSTNYISQSHQSSLSSTPGDKNLKLDLGHPLVAVHGTNISSHYLDENSMFSLYRYEGSVYAVDNTNSTSVRLWASQNKEMPHQSSYLGRGNYGAVFQKTDFKAVKIVTRETSFSLQELHQKNEQLLKIKFATKNLGVANSFNIGLWNVKDLENPKYIMPLIQSSDLEPTNEDTEYFLESLFKLNSAGIAHPDLASSYRHISKQNVMYTDKGFVAIDMDEPVIGNNYFKDQWLWFSNPNNPHIVEFYEKNPRVSLTDTPQVLEKLCMEALFAENPIYVPLHAQKVMEFGEDYKEIMEHLDLAKWKH